MKEMPKYELWKGTRAMTSVTNLFDLMALPPLSPRLAPGPGKGAHAEIQEEQREQARQDHPADSRSTVNVTVIFANGGPGAHQRKRQEEKPGDFQPERMQHAARAAQRGTASLV